MNSNFTEKYKLYFHKILIIGSNKVKSNIPERFFSSPDQIVITKNNMELKKMMNSIK